MKGNTKLQQSARLQKAQDGRVLGLCLFVPAHILPDLPLGVDVLDFETEVSGDKITIKVKSISKQGGVTHSKSSLVQGPNLGGTHVG